MRTGAAILVKILRKCALRETHARAPDRSCAHRRCTHRPLTAYSVLGSTPSWPEVATPHSHKGASLDAVSAFDLFGHEPADAGGHADWKQRLDSEQHRSRAGTARLRRSYLAGNGFRVIHAARHQHARGRRIF